MKDLFKIGATIFLIGFGLNLVWEVIQTILIFRFSFPGPGAAFCGYSSQGHGGGCCLHNANLLAGNVAIPEIRNGSRHFTLFRASVAMLAGFLIAVHIEQRALETGRWSYGQLMPIIPYVQVGLMPVLQMMILPMAHLYHQ